MSGPDALTRSVLADQVKERMLEAILKLKLSGRLHTRTDEVEYVRRTAL